MGDERAFLKAVMENPEDDSRKLVYADWLEERGETTKAEFLRLVVKVRQDRVISPEQRQWHQELAAELAELRAQEWQAWDEGRPSPQENHDRRRQVHEAERQLAALSEHMRQNIPERLRELSARLDPTWLAVMSDPEIEGCGKGTTEGWLRFDFVCDKTWADLKPTDDEVTRHCETCSKNVHFCDNLVDARKHADENHCVAVDLGIRRQEGDLTPEVEMVSMAILGGPMQERRVTYDKDLDPVPRVRLAARGQGGKKRTRRRR